MKIAVIGGSAFSTPGLVCFLGGHKPPTPIEVVLAGRSFKNLQAVRRASILSGSGDVQIRCEQVGPAAWHQILDGADCVLIQVRVGGYAGRAFDENFPHKYGLCGDEGLGAGGLSVGWRTWPVIAEILEAIGEFCPEAFAILMTSPLSLLVRASYEAAELNLVGICELPWTTLQNLRQSIGPAGAGLEADYLGVNHLGWFFNFHSGSHPLNDELAASIPETSFAASSFLRGYCCLPTRYLRMHYEPEKVLGEQVSQQRTRAEALAELQHHAYNTYSLGSAEEIAALFPARQAPWYPHAIGPLLLALAGRSTDMPFFLSVRNGSYTDVLEENDVVECRHHWVDGKLQKTPLTGPAPRHLVDNLLPFVEFERTAAEAIMTRSLPLLIDALSLHPWTQGHPQLQAIAGEIVTYNEVMATACQ
jgi:6-phospho-beta-glucosidase